MKELKKPHNPIDIQFIVARVDVTNKLLPAKLYQYLEILTKIEPRRRKLEVSDIRGLKTKFKGRKTTQRNAFIIDLLKVFLGLKICVCVRVC